MRVATMKDASAVAIIGMAGRFPGAKDVSEFWRNLSNGVDSLSHFSREELLQAGVSPQLLDNPAYVAVGTHLEGADEFDASFFGVNPREAEVMDPQHRIFLECAWEALEDAGCDTERYSGSIGVFAGSSMNGYFANNLLTNLDVLASVGPFQTMIGNDKDFLTTRVSYKLNLRGPSVAVQTACSTSLVAVQLACQSLLAHQCDIGLAGGVSVGFPQKTGYLYQEGMIFSPDGRCRPFDARAQGIRPGEGVGIVVLKRLEEALRDGDNIHAVILGAAINNDGAIKIGYTAPSVDGQAEAITAAQAQADVSPEAISYIEAHGTATPLGDPIEIAALVKVFRASTSARQFCAIGSLKSNIGHLDIAAGVAGLLKTVLALKHRKIPPSLYYESPNPQIDFSSSPFYVNTSLSEWTSNGAPRRAGVSSFGIGGTNAHVILEESPQLSSSPANRPYYALIWSAKTPVALELATSNFLEWLKNNPEANVADVSHTLQVGRRAFEHRRALVCQDTQEAQTALQSKDRRKIYTSHSADAQRSVVFMFSGQGSQYVNMAAEVYRTEEVFRDNLDKCSELLRLPLGVDLRSVLYPAESNNGWGEPSLLNQTWVAQPALLAVEYSLAKLWMYWGIEPKCMIGHSIGEYTAACLAGVFSLEDALDLMAVRGRLMQEMPTGAMTVVPMAESDLREYLDEGVSVAAVNTPTLSVASGPTKMIERLEKQLERDGHDCQRLHTSHAFHSQMMERAVGPFVKAVARVNRNEPRIPFVSNLTGTWISPVEATDPEYWGRHLRETVQFAAGVTEIAKTHGQVYLEIGPGYTLKTLTRQVLKGVSEDYILSSLPHAHESKSDDGFLLNSLCRLWLAKVPVSWSRLEAQSKRHKISLPTYPFERKRYYIAPRREQPQAKLSVQDKISRREEIENWFWVYSWKRTGALAMLKPQLDRIKAVRWLIFLDRCGVGAAIVKQLKAHGADVVAVDLGVRFARISENTYSITAGNRADYDLLFKEILSTGKHPDRIVHLWNVSPKVELDAEAALRNVEETQDKSFYSLLHLAQILSDANLGVEANPEILIASNGMQTITGDDGWCPEKAILLGPCRVLPKEHAHIYTRSVDVEIGEKDSTNSGDVATALLGEITGKFTENTVAYRGRYRWVQCVEPTRLEPNSEPHSYLRPGGTYLITGGLGGIGLKIAEHFATVARARLILTSRTGLPPASEWSPWIESHGDNDLVSMKIRQVQALEEKGSEVIVAAADSGNEDQMKEVIARATDRFGSINGVIHAAGVASTEEIQFKSRETVSMVLNPKLRGTLVLERLFDGVKLDFFALCSSIAALYGYLGLVDYCSANAYLDAFALSRERRGSGRVVSINWDNWQEVGMATKVEVPEYLKERRQKFMEQGIKPQEGIDALNRVLTSSLPQVLVVTKDLTDLAAQLNIFDSPRAPEKGEKPGLPGSLAVAKQTAQQHGRPELSNSYVAPRTHLETVLVNIWNELLGMDSIGVEDNFFDLGGHSLLATRVLSRVQEILRIRLPIRVVFDAPTISELAEHLQSVGLQREATTASTSSNKAEDREEIQL